MPPRKPTNESVRGREYLTPAEVQRLVKAAAALGRHGHRDATMILVASTHGLRVSELVALRRDQVDLDQGTLHVRRKKRGIPSTHPLRGREVRELRRVLRDYPGAATVFVSERGGPLDRSTVQKILRRAGQAAGLGDHVHPHMLRHACGFKLANEGRDTRSIQHYLGHRNIQHTVRYTELSAERFRDFWDD
jgi:site-specific recombinase XerD